jgi:hypothetical protein
MARRKNVKRIDPRYFLHETVNRGDELEEANWADEPEADRPWSYKPSSAGGYSAQVDREKPAARTKRRGKPTRPENGESYEEFFQRQADWVNKRLGKLKEAEIEEGLFPKGSVASWGEKWVTDKAKSAGSAIAGAFKGKEEEPPPPDPDSDEGKVAAVWGPITKKLYYFKPSPDRPMKMYKYFYEKRRAEGKAKRLHWGPDQFQWLALWDLEEWAKGQEKQARSEDPEVKAKIAAKYEKVYVDRAEEKRRRLRGGRSSTMASDDLRPGETMATRTYEIMINRKRAADKGWDRDTALDNGLSVDGNFGREWRGEAPDPDRLEAARKAARESTRGVGRSSTYGYGR